MQYETTCSGKYGVVDRLTQLSSFYPDISLRKNDQLSADLTQMRTDRTGGVTCNRRDPGPVDLVDNRHQSLVSEQDMVRVTACIAPLGAPKLT